MNTKFTVGAPSPWEIKTAKELYEEKCKKSDGFFGGATSFRRFFKFKTQRLNQCVTLFAEIA
jgi:hypothetical protein